MPVNSGRLPDEAKIIDTGSGQVRGYRQVNVRLRNGWTSRISGPWPAAGGKPPTRWSLEDHPFDITHFEVVK